MHNLISKDRFDNDVLFSMLIDAANIFYRHKLPGASLDHAWLDWRNNAIETFLPIGSAALPLSALQVTPTTSVPNCVCFVDVPLDKLEKVAAEFLVYLLRDAGAKGIATLDHSGGLEQAVQDVAHRVAKSWTRAWL